MGRFNSEDRSGPEKFSGRAVNRFLIFFDSSVVLLDWNAHQLGRAAFMGVFLVATVLINKRSFGSYW